MLPNLTLLPPILWNWLLHVPFHGWVMLSKVSTCTATKEIRLQANSVTRLYKWIIFCLLHFYLVYVRHGSSAVAMHLEYNNFEVQKIIGKYFIFRMFNKINEYKFIYLLIPRNKWAHNISEAPCWVNNILEYDVVLKSVWKNSFLND